MKHAVSIFLLVFLVGCATAPNTPAKSIAAGYVTIETLAEATQVAYVDGSITEEQKASIKQELNSAIIQLKTGEQLLMIDKSPETYINVTTEILQRIADKLKENANE